MMHVLLTISRAIDRMNSIIGRMACWLVIVIVLIASVNAVIRKVFDSSSNAWLEAQWVLFGATLFLCAPWTLALNEHIRIDVLSTRLPPSARKGIDLLGHAFFLLPFTIVMIATTIPFLIRSIGTNEQSMNAGGIPQWLPKSFILMGFGLLLLQAISEFIKRLAGPGNAGSAASEPNQLHVPIRNDRPAGDGADCRR